MATNIIMPQMGESITEGTITKWLKREGESIERDQPLFEISTDKVDTEIPSSVAGVLQKILMPEGTKVPINSVVAVIEENPGAASPKKVEPKPEVILPPEKAEPKPEPLSPTFVPATKVIAQESYPQQKEERKPAPVVTGWPARRHVPIPDPPPVNGGATVSLEATDWTKRSKTREFDDLVYCLRCGSVVVARVALQCGDAVVPDVVHEGIPCRICLKTQYKLVRMRGDLGFLR